MNLKRDPRMQAHVEELAEHISRALPEDGHREPLEGLHVYRASSTMRLHGVSTPGFCLIAQGSKEIALASEHYRYDPANYLLVTSSLPIISRIIEASPERPYLSLRLGLDPTLVSSVMIESGHVSMNHTDVRAFDVSGLELDLLDAVLRLIRLLDKPNEATFLLPLIKREIIFRLLKGEQSGRLRQIATVGGHNHRMAKAIERIRKEFDQTLSIETIASDLAMSVSSFHHHFKTVTAMSPLQFQKQLRLQEARRLMLGENLDAASAAYRVGYDDASHFNREYKRLFGLPPMRDVERLREMNGENAGLEPAFSGRENSERSSTSRLSAN